jgi:16S rRNA C1402 N4-methylase RsmH
VESHQENAKVKMKMDKKAIIPTKEELHNNPRARSAQLRIAERK